MGASLLACRADCGGWWSYVLEAQSVRAGCREWHVTFCVSNTTMPMETVHTVFLLNQTAVTAAAEGGHLR